MPLGPTLRGRCEFGASVDLICINEFEERRQDLIGRYRAGECLESYLQQRQSVKCLLFEQSIAKLGINYADEICLKRLDLVEMCVK